ncbi:MAG: crossover junction endodeoxyribonuclease RuvC, partial [Rubripirellula sp.]
LPVAELAPAEIKKSVSGHGRASKAQMQEAVRAQLQLQETPEPHDVADALAIALCGYHLGDGTSMEALSKSS